MRFLNKFFKKEAEEKKTINSDELENWLKDRIQRAKEESKKKSEPIIREILSEAEGIREIAHSIENSEVPEEIPKRSRKIILISKPLFVHSILEALEKIKANGEGIQESLSAISKITFTQGRYLPLAFGEEIDQIRRECRKIMEKSRKLNETKPEVKFIQSLEILSEMKRKEERIESMKKDEYSIEERIDEYSKNLEKLQKEYNALDETEVHEKEKELKRIREIRDRTETEIYGIITPLKRPMKKFRKLRGSVMGIDSYIENPMEKFLSDKSGNLKEILTEIKKSIETRELKIKEGERKKIMAAFHADLKKLREELLELRQRESEISEEVKKSPVLAQKKELEMELKKIKREISRGEDELKKIKRKENSIKEEIPSLKKTLEEKLQVRIRWDVFNPEI